MCFYLISVCGLPSQKSETSVLILSSIKSIYIVASLSSVSLLLMSLILFTESGLKELVSVFAPFAKCNASVPCLMLCFLGDVGGKCF